MAEMETKTEKAPDSVLSSFIRTLLGTQRDDRMKDDFRKSWRRRTGGTILLLMYLAVFYIVVMSLTAYQIQTRIHALRGQGNTLTIWTVTRMADQILSAQRKIDSLILDRDIQQSDLEALRRGEYLEIGNKFYDVELRIDSLVRQFDKSVPLEATIDRTSAIEKFENNGILPESAKAIKDEYLKIVAEWNRIEAKEKAITRNIAELDSRIQVATKKKDNDIKNMPNYANAIDLTDELKFFHRSSNTGGDGIFHIGFDYIFGNNNRYYGGKSSYQFVTLPSEVLIMLVVIAMGTMGSMISITQVFFAGEDRPVTFYIFRPLLGAVVAIGVYVITKAGVIVASNLPDGSEGTAKLNAFFVSFLSLVAGLMSDAAIGTIKRAGTSFLRGDPITEQTRYAKGIAAVMAEDNKTSRDLYPFFDVSPEVVDKWLAEKEKVPGEAQRIIAAWLEKPVREIFSDLPPSGPVEGNQP